MKTTYDAELLKYLWDFLTPEKRKRIEHVLSNRTRFITLVLEDIYQSHNANAIIRTADCFGLQDIHVIQQKTRFITHSSIARGATQWVDIYKYSTTMQAFNELKMKGYSIVATSPDAECSVLDYQINKKIALVFGNEAEGLSEFAKLQADYLVKIPMYGFTQSFNVSVSAALCLQDLVTRLHLSSCTWQLTVDEKKLLALVWSRTIIPAAKYLEKNFLQKRI